MADSGLDDFFAKKDKSKKKSSKFTTNDILAKQTEKPKKSKKKDKVAGEKSTQAGSTSSSTAKNIKKPDEDEWHDYKDEEEKDFSDLKIQNIQVKSKEDEDESERPGEGAGSDGEEGGGREKRDVPSGPWNKSNTPSEVTVVLVQPESKPEPPKEEPTTRGKYIPPGMRRAMESGASGGSLAPASNTRYGRKKKTPDVMSELDFPTLGGAGEGAQDSASSHVSNTRFEQVRGGGGRQTSDPSGQSQGLEIANKFDALLEADS